MQILILTMHESEQLVRDSFFRRTGYLIKGDEAHELVAAIDALCRRKLFLTSSVAERIVRGYRPVGSSGAISPREREIVQLVAEGKFNKEIAATLAISVKTVETHRDCTDSAVGFVVCISLK